MRRTLIGITHHVDLSQVGKRPPNSRRARSHRPGERRRCPLGLEPLENRSLLSGPGTIGFQLLATVGDPLPGPAGGTFVNDFEPGGLNNHGDVAFGADASTGGEGIFLRDHGQIVELARTGGAAPGGGTYEFGFLGPVGLNDPGDLVFDFLLKDFSQPLGTNAGAYRVSHTTGTVTPIVVPYVTPAPGGGSFQGVFFQPTINNRGDVAFAGIVKTDKGVHVPGEDYVGLGLGVFRADASGRITSVVSPGDPAPGGRTFDYAVEPWINQGGDVSFEGHVAGEDSVIAGFPPQAEEISALSSLYVKEANGTIRSIVHAGDPAPGGGVFRQAFHDVMNDRGDIVFIGDLTPAPGAQEQVGVFLATGGQIMAIARPGDSMPGGGHLVNASLVGGNVHINNAGDVVFTGQLDDDQDGDGTLDTGLFQWSHGQLSLIARSGTAIPGVGTIYQLAATQLIFPPPPTVTPTSGAINNDRGQVIFEASLTNGKVVLLLATPGGRGKGDVAVNSLASAAPALMASGVGQDLTGFVGVLPQPVTAFPTMVPAAGRKHSLRTPSDGLVSTLLAGPSDGALG